VLVSWIVRDVIDFEVLTESQEGLLLAFDHTMFIGVMTNIMFGVLAVRLSSPRTMLANKVVWVGVNVGLIGFGLGLLTTTTLLKQIFAPIMGLSLLFALVVYLMELRAATVEPSETMVAA
jgi:predicted membrane protein